MASAAVADGGPADDSLFTQMFSNLEPRRKLLTIVSCNMMDPLETFIQEKLLSLDAPLQDQNGDRALHIACSKGHHPCVRRLIDAGANPDISNDFGFTPMAHALRNNHVECVRLLLLSGSPLSDPSIIWLSRKSNDVYTWTSYKADMITLLFIATPNFSAQGPDIVQTMFTVFLNKHDTGEVVRYYLMTGNKLSDSQMTQIIQQSNRDMTQWLRNFQRPKTLQHCCRLTLRKSLAPNVLFAAKQLEIPQRLQGYILFDDMNF